MASPSSRYRRCTHLWLASTRAPRYQSLLTTDGRTTFVRFKRRAAGRYTPRKLERLREPGFQEFAQLGRSLELWDGIQFLECRGERIRKTPDRSRDDHLGGDVRQFTSLPGFHLLGSSATTTITVNPAPSTIVLAPSMAGPDVTGTAQTLTATVTQAGVPVVGTAVQFTVTGVNATSGNATTNGTGVAT